MSKIVGRKPIELKLSDQLNGYIPVYNSSSRLWGTISKNDFITGSAFTSGSNIFIGNQTISGSLTVYQGITGSLFGTASYADNAWALGGNTFAGGAADRVLGTLSNHHLSIYASGSRVATFTNSGSLFIAPYLPGILNDEIFLIDAGVTTSPDLIRALSDIDNYSQISIQNFSTGSNASSDVIAIANNGSELGYYIDMGINNSTFSGSIGAANDAYLYSTGNDLHIGNASNHPIQFFAGGIDNNANRKFQLNPNNSHQMTGSLDVSGSVTAQSFTGSLFGTSSYAVQALTASNATTASYWSGSIINAATASYVVQAQSASYWSGSIINAATASYVLQAISASYATTSSYAETASNAPNYLPLAGGTMTGDIYAAGRSFTFQDLLLGAGTTFGKITTDGSKYISIMPTYNVESARFWPNGNVTIQDAGTYVDNGFRLDVSGSGRFTDGLTVTGSLQAINGITGSLLGTASQALTASSADNFTVRGTLTAQTLVAQTITSSIEFITGSTRNGSLLTNTHQFTGSVGITGSLTVNGSDYTTTSGSASTRLTALETFSGSYSTGSFTGSFIGRVTGSFSGSLHNLQNTLIGHIPFFTSSQVLADSVVRQLDNGSGSYSIVINQDNITTAAPEALYVWQPSDTSYNIIAGKGNLNNYLQLNIQNLNTGENASSDVVATANNGNETSNYIDMGINSEGFTGSIGNENDAYLYSTGKNLHIGTATNYPIQFFAGGIDNEANRKFQLNPNNSHELTGSLSITNRLNVIGGVTASLQGTASWANNAITASHALQASSASFALTASSVNRLNQNVVISGSLTVTGSTNIIGNSGTTLFSSNADTLVFTGSLFTTGSIISTGSLNILGGITGSLFGTASYAVQALTASNANTASFVQNAQSASYVLNAISASYSSTASSADDFTVRGILIAQTINVQTITSSIEFVTGSTKNGSLSTNTHQFTGSVLISSSLDVGINATVGALNVASGRYSFANGYNNQATSFQSHAQGNSTLASGNTSHAEGSNTIASGDFSHAEGQNTTSSGTRSHSEGSLSLSSGTNSHAEGLSTIASGDNSHAEGNTTTASGNSSHAEGVGTTASGLYSHVEGYYATASGNRTHAEGEFTNAVGIGSHAEGSGSVAFGNNSHAEGIFTIASGSGQLAVGRYNTHGNTTSLFVIGNGIEGSRSDLVQFNPTSIQFNAPLSGSSFTGSLQGTSSYATQAQSASYWSGSIINAATASYAETAQTASYVLNTVSASYASTSSYLNPIENSYLVLSQVSQSLNFQDDTEAAAGGVPLGGLYRNGNFILIRIV